MIKVVNKHWHKPTPNDVYIGRGSPFGNPYSHMKGTKAEHIVATREEAIEKYRTWFNEQLKTNIILSELLNVMLSTVLKGNDLNLVCYCAPMPCHGEVIKECLEGAIARRV